jgi:hypothetical protein
MGILFENPVDPFMVSYLHATLRRFVSLRVTPRQTPGNMGCFLSPAGKTALQPLACSRGIKTILTECLIKINKKRNSMFTAWPPCK